MQNILAKFDDDSRKIIKELIKDNKFTGLIDKLQTARNKLDNRIKITDALAQEIRK